MSHRILIQGDRIHVIGDDPTKFAQLGQTISAGRFADVHPVCEDGQMYWTVAKDGYIYGKFGTREEALTFESELAEKWHRTFY